MGKTSEIKHVIVDNFISRNGCLIHKHLLTEYFFLFSQNSISCDQKHSKPSLHTQVTQFSGYYLNFLNLYISKANYPFHIKYVIILNLFIQNE